MRNASKGDGTSVDRSTGTSTPLSRRRFLFALGAGSAGAAAVVAAPAVAAAAPVAAPVAAATDGGYRETEHVRDYYDSARI